MSRVFVVEPYKMLQQAFVVALSDEHQVQAAEKIPEPSTEADVVIFDAAALRERGLLTVREIQACKIPVIWVDEGPAAGSPLPNAIPLSAPFTRDELRAAVAKCLELPRPEQRSKPPSEGRPDPALAGKTSRAEPESTQEFIELVDVFEETPQGKTDDAKARNRR
jgi:hypothetical protein